MNWEEKLMELLEIPENTKQKFRTGIRGDDDVGGLLVKKFSPEIIYKNIKEHVDEGDIFSIQKKLPEFKQVVARWKIILRHLGTNKACVDYTANDDNFYYKSGIFRLGYSFAPNGLEGIKNNMLKYHRLINHAIIRAKKHPRYREI